MNDDSPVNDNLVRVQSCPNRIVAEVMAGLLRSESVPAMVRSPGPIPGLESGAEVQVPPSWLSRPQRLLALREPTEEELAELATRAPPDRSHRGG